MNPRIVHVRSGFTMGGPEQVLLGGLEELRGEFEFDVASFVLPHRPNDFLTETANRGFATAPILIRSSFDSAAIPQVQTALRDAKLVVTHDYRALGLSISAMKKSGTLGRVPLVTVSHGWTAHTWKVRIYEWLERRWYRHAARIVAVSKAKEQELLSRGMQPDRVCLIENGVRIPAPISASERAAIRTECGVKENEFMIITVGRLSPEKAQMNLILALGELKNDFPNVRAFLIGDGVLRDELTAELNKLGLHDKVSIVGWRNDTARWYSAADLFVLPSLTEGLPMALLEAQSYGLPAIASNVGGCGDVIVDGVSGLLVPPGEISALRNAISKAASETAWLAQAGIAARERIISRYSVTRYASDWRTLYHELLTGES